MNWFFRRKSSDNPIVQSYLDSNYGWKPKRASLLDDLRIVAIDAETTGFDLDEDRMLSLAVVEIRGGCLRMPTMRSWMIQQDNAQLTEAVKVHGILPDDTAGGLSEEAALLELLPLLERSLIVGHHIRFDTGMIDAALRRHFGIRLRNPVVDTADLIAHVVDAFEKTGYANQRPPTLDEACAKMGLDPMLRHTAAGDAFTTGQLFLMLAARLRQQVGHALQVGDVLGGAPIGWSFFGGAD